MCTLRNPELLIFQSVNMPDFDRAAKLHFVYAHAYTDIFRNTVWKHPTYEPLRAFNFFYPHPVILYTEFIFTAVRTDSVVDD